MKNVLKSPTNTKSIMFNGLPTVFLAGSIEMGSAENWQEEITNALDNCNILNPRRDDWDSSWVQSKDNPQFSEQVIWEYNALINSSIIAFYFDPNTKSPITLLELGVVLESMKNVVVYCPEGYWRKGNVDIYCDFYNVPVFEDKEKFINHVKDIIDCLQYLS